MAASCYNMMGRRIQPMEERGEGGRKKQGQESATTTTRTRVAVVKPMSIQEKEPLKKTAPLLDRQPLKEHFSTRQNNTVAQSLKPTCVDKPVKREKPVQPTICDPVTTLAIPRKETISHEQTLPITDVLQSGKIVEIDDDSTFYCIEYAEEIFKYMQQSEQMDCYNIPRDFLSRQRTINSYNRAVLIDWLVQVHSKFCLLQETLHITVDTLDRFLKVNRIEKRQLQLVGITAMFVASKYEEIYPPCVGDFTYISANTYTNKQICRMETNILESLDYKLNKPFSLQFLRRYSKITKSTTQEHSMAKFILETAMMDCNLVSMRPSLRAAGALVLAHHLLNSKRAAEAMTILEKYCDFSEFEITEVKRILRANLTVPLYTTVLKSIMKKYTTKEFLEVAKHSGVLAIGQKRKN